MTRFFHDAQTAPPLPADLMLRPCLKLDLGRGNARLHGLDVADPYAFDAWIAVQMREQGCAWAAGGYSEDRAIYEMSPLFGSADSLRSVHLGVDLWMPAGTPVFAIADGRVHSFADNAQFGDYGPTIILEHAGADGRPIFSLYGHLARASLQTLALGQSVKAGQQIARLGAPEENLGWAPHLHLQLMLDLQGCEGDYPGVCAAAEAAAWLDRCPDPWPLLEAWCPDVRG